MSIIVTSVTLVGCSRRRPELLVFAASSTTDAVREIAHDFEPICGCVVRISVGSSSDLARQIIAGAPADLFLSADRAKVDALEQQGMSRREDRFDLLSNSLCVITSSTSSRNMSSAEGLMSFGKIALPDHGAVPLGIYAKTWLETKRLWESVLPHVVTTLDARATVAAVENGSADVGIVYQSDALSAKSARVIYRVPHAELPDIVYPLVRTTHSQSNNARVFFQFLRGPGARKTFIRFGFTPLFDDR
ncbi:MAG: molybdate ABC transporter substrate-binding protein [Polyangiales bacterium]